MTTSVTHRTDGDVEADAGRYGFARYGFYESGGVRPASSLAVSHRADGVAAVAHTNTGTTSVTHR